MIEAQALDRVANRPFDQLGAERAAEFEVERPRARLLDRAADPEIVVDGAKQRLAAIFAVEQHAEARSSRRDFRRRFDREALEGADTLARRLRLVGDLLELRAMIDGEGHQIVWLAPARRGAMRDGASRASRTAASPAKSDIRPNREGARRRRRRRRWRRRSRFRSA